MASAIRFSQTILGLDEPPHTGDAVLDLGGAWVLPGLINAHDHLELNHYGRLVGSGGYGNATEWIDELRPQLRANTAIRRNQSFALRDRLLIGAIKNLLSGVTLVAHHNPKYADLLGLPVRVVAPYGWAHSYALQGHPVGAHGEPGPEIARARRQTTADAPFFVHAAEGTDTAAAAETSRLAEDDCLRPGTVLVHGVAISVAEWRRLIESGVSLVWCPSSNHAMFGTTAPVRAFLDAHCASADRICLGTDSRLTGSRDLLDEMRAAADFGCVGADELLRMVTTSAATVVRVEHAGRLSIGGPADLVVVPPVRETAAQSLVATSRSDLQAVVIGGAPVIAAPALAQLFHARRVGGACLFVDGVERIAARPVVSELARCPIVEPGIAFEHARN